MFHIKKLLMDTNKNQNLNMKDEYCEETCDCEEYCDYCGGRCEGIVLSKPTQKKKKKYNC